LLHLLELALDLAAADVDLLESLLQLLSRRTVLGSCVTSSRNVASQSRALRVRSEMSDLAASTISAACRRDPGRPRRHLLPVSDSTKAAVAEAGRGQDRGIEGHRLGGEQATEHRGPLLPALSEELREVRRPGPPDPGLERQLDLVVRGADLGCR